MGSSSLSRLLVAVCGLLVLCNVAIGLQPSDNLELHARVANSDLRLSAFEQTDCSNATHRWQSVEGNCFDEHGGPIPYIPPPKQEPVFGRYIGGLGIRIRDSNCAPDETRCWVVNCCQPGQTCGPINVGCTVSYSTIYTTTTVSLTSTQYQIITPARVTATTTVKTTSTTYVTSFRHVTATGAGMNTVLDTSTITTTSLILSASTPPPVTVTKTVSLGPDVTTGPVRRRETARAVLPRAEIPRRQESIQYTLDTVFVTLFYTAHATSTLTDRIATVTKTKTVTSAATQNLTFYQTPTGFTTSVLTSTVVIPSYAYGALEPETVTSTITNIPTTSVVAGASPTGSDPAETNPPGAHSPSSSHKLTGGQIAGIVVGLILLLIILALIIVFVCCLRRKRRRQSVYAQDDRYLVEVPTPPSPPTPQMATASPSPIFHNNRGGSPEFGQDAITIIGRPGNGNGNGNGNGYRHARKGSRVSVVSIEPVPEEDEGEDEEVLREPNRTLRRSSGESVHSWGRGYGGRGGFYGRTGDVRSRNMETGSPTHPAYGGAIRSTYSDENLVPPHARGT